MKNLAGLKKGGASCVGQRCAGALVVLMLSGASSVAVQAQSSLEDCMGVEDAVLRLNCYDRVAAGADSVQPPAVPSTVNEVMPAEEIPRVNQAETTSAAAEEAATISPNVVQAETETAEPEGAGRRLFGLFGKKKEESEQSRDDLIRIVVASANYNRFTGWRIETTEGQTWQQIGTDSYKITEGETYFIAQGIFDSYQLGNADNNRKIRVSLED